MDFINRQIVNAQAAVHVAWDSLADRLTDREEGQALVEYGLILVLVSVVAVVGLTALSGQLYVGSLPTGAVVTAGSPPVAGTMPGTAPVFNKIIFALSNGYRAF